jgi:hypothetical protein
MLINFDAFISEKYFEVYERKKYKRELRENVSIEKC